MDINAIESDLDSRLKDIKKSLDDFGEKARGAAAGASSEALHNLHKKAQGTQNQKSGIQAQRR